MTSLPSYVMVFKEGWQETRISDLIRVEFERGPAQQRPINCRPLFDLQFKIGLCNCEDYINFLKWYDNDLCHGSQFFLMIDPCNPTVNLKVRFKDGDITYQRVQDGYEASLVVEIWGRHE